jgi:Sec-independent protein translocase protein TatA
MGKFEDKITAKYQQLNEEDLTVDTIAAPGSVVDQLIAQKEQGGKMLIDAIASKLSDPNTSAEMKNDIAAFVTGVKDIASQLQNQNQPQQQDQQQDQQQNQQQNQQVQPQQQSQQQTSPEAAAIQSGTTAPQGQVG